MATRTPPPLFDLVAAIGELLEASGVSIDTLRNADRAARDLAQDFLHAPIEQRSALRLAALVGYLVAFNKGFHLGEMAVEEWRWRLLNVAGRSYADGQLDGEAYGFVLGLLIPGRNLVVSDDDARVVH